MKNTLRQDNHVALDMIIAEYLINNPGSTPSTVSGIELLEWHDKKIKEESKADDESRARLTGTETSTRQ